MNKKGFTLIELLVVIAIIGILSGLIFVLGNSAINAANDAKRKSDVAAMYTSILARGTSSGSYPGLASDITPANTPLNLQDYILSYLGKVPSDPTGDKNYFYYSNGNDFVVGAFLSTGKCFTKQTKGDLFTDTDCTLAKEGGVGLVANFMILNGGGTYNLSWAIPAQYSLSNPTTSTALICLGQNKNDNSIPTETQLFTLGKIVAIINGTNQYNYFASDTDYKYFCQAITYNNSITTNPGSIGSTPNTNSGGFDLAKISKVNNDTGGVNGDYVASSPTYSSYATPNVLPSIDGTTNTGGRTSETFTSSIAPGPNGTATITLSWTPGTLSTSTIIRRTKSATADPNIAPQTLTDGVEVYNKRNDDQGQNPLAVHTYVDSGLDASQYYCYSAWAYNQNTNTYSAGFVLACSGIAPSAPTNVTMYSSTNSFTLTWVPGSATNTVIRRQVDTPASTQTQGTLVYNDTQTLVNGLATITDGDAGLTQNTNYCYSLWAYNPTTQKISDDFISSCGILNLVGNPSNLVFSSIAYNSMVLTWTQAVNSTTSVVVRKQGSIPANRTDGIEIYNASGVTVMDSGLSTGTNYCYAIWGRNGTGYSSAPLTGCSTTRQDAACGTKDGKYAISTPTGTEACANGTATGMTGSYSWTCTIANGSPASCSTAAANYSSLQFTSSNTWTVPNGVTQIDYLVIAGGGAGGTGLHGGGGGGAGGVRTGSASVGSSATITVGLGGTSTANVGNNGGNSSLVSGATSIIATGGGGGGSEISAVPGIAGGSGGGGAPQSGVGGDADYLSPRQGYDGGVGNAVPGGGEYAAGGGGGAGGVGGAAASSAGGNGGIGITNNISGSSVQYAGGGGGGSSYGANGGGTSSYGGGVGGSRARGVPTAGATNTGGGGGGGGYSGAYTGASGGSGIVIVRWVTNL